MSQRIYVVTDKLNNNTRLVEAGNPAQAVRHVTADQFDVAPATTYAVAALVANGVKLETTKAEAVEQE